MNTDKSIISAIDTLVAFTLPLLVIVIVKLTRPKTSMVLAETSLTTVMFTGATSTVSLALISVAFSLQTAVTTLVHLPVALDLATISNSKYPFVNLSKCHLIS